MERGQYQELFGKMKELYQKRRIARFFLPGVFLAVLGIGNVLVGLYKEAQYEQVLHGLSSNETILGLQKASPLTRIQLLRQKAHRLYHRRKKALARVDFYRLVIFGGKVFLFLSIPFLVGAAALAVFPHLITHYNSAPPKQNQLV